MENEILGGQPAEVNADTAIAHINESLKAVERVQHPIGLDRHFGNDNLPDVADGIDPHTHTSFESLYNSEKLAHDFTKHQLDAAMGMIKRAETMGFKFGVGIHGGA